MKLHAPRLDLRQIEHVVDQREEVASRRVDLLEVRNQRVLPGLLRVLLEHLAVADDGVERCAQFVAHRGEKLALRLVGGLGRLAGGEELGDVVIETHHADEPPVHHHRDAEDLDVHQRAVLAATLGDGPDRVMIERLLRVLDRLSPRLRRRDQIVEMLTEHLLFGVAVQREERRVARHHDVLRVERDDRHGTVRHQLPEVLLLMLGLREQSRVLDGDCGFGSEQLEQPEIFGAQVPILVGVDAGDDPDEPRTDDERGGHHRLHGALGVLRGPSFPILIARDDEGLQRLGHAAHGSLPHGDPHAHGVGAHVVARHDDQIACRLVVRGQLPTGHIEQRHRPLEHALQHARQFELAREVLHGIEQGLLLLGTPPFDGKETRILDRHRGLRRKEIEQPQIVFPELPCALFVHEGDGPHELPAHHQRRHHHGVELDLGVLTGPSRPLLVVRDHQGLAGQGNMSHRPFAEPHPRARGLLLPHVVARDDLQLLAIRIVDGQLAVTHLEQLHRAFEHGLQQLGQLELGRQRRHRRTERLLLVGPLPLRREQAGAADGDARLMRRRPQHLEVVSAERTRTVALHYEHPDQLLVHEERHVHLGALVARREVPGVFGHLRRVVQPPIQERQLAEALPRPHPESGRCVVAAPARHHDPVARGVVHEQHRHEVEAERRVLETVGHRLADVGLRVRGRDRTAEAEQRRFAMPSGGLVGTSTRSRAPGLHAVTVELLFRACSDTRRRTSARSPSISRDRFSTTPRTPPLRRSRSLAVRSLAVITITGGWSPESRDRSASRNSKPSISGIMRSSRTSSGAADSSRSSPTRPFSASVTVQPSCSSECRSEARVAESSSTISTPAPEDRR